MLELGDIFRIPEERSIHVLCQHGGDRIAVSLATGVERKILNEDDYSIELAGHFHEYRFEVAESVWYDPIESPSDDPHNRPYGVPFSLDVDGQELMMLVSNLRIFTMDGKYMDWKMLFWPDIIHGGQWYSLKFNGVPTR